MRHWLHEPVDKLYHIHLTIREQNPVMDTQGQHSNKNQPNTLSFHPLLEVTYPHPVLVAQSYHPPAPDALTEFAGGVPAKTAATPVEAVETALSGPRRVVVSGSLYLAGMVLEHYAPETVLDL